MVGSNLTGSSLRLVDTMIKDLKDLGIEVEKVSDTESTEPETIKVDAGTETKYKVSYSSAPVWLIVVTVIQGVLLLAAAAMWFIIQFYKGKKKRISV